jgi:hypothetical protein
MRMAIYINIRLCVHMCMHMYMYVHRRWGTLWRLVMSAMYVHWHIYEYMNNICIYISAYVYVCRQEMENSVTPSNVGFMYICTWMHTCTCAYCICVHTYIHVCNIYTHIYIHIYTYIHTYKNNNNIWKYIYINMDI